MQWLLAHLRNKILAGAVSAVPVVILVYAALWAEQSTRELTRPLGYHYPGLGVLVALVAVYLLGLIVTSVVGQFVLGLAHRLLEKVPGLNLLYKAFKDVMVLSPDRAGMFHQVVLVPNPGGRGAQLGFTSGTPLPADPRFICVLLPNIPNPYSGRLLVVERDNCLFVNVTVEEALKFQISTGNYLPPQMVGARPTPTAQA